MMYLKMDPFMDDSAKCMDSLISHIIYGHHCTTPKKHLNIQTFLEKN